MVVSDSDYDDFINESLASSYQEREIHVTDGDPGDDFDNHTGVIFVLVVILELMRT
jgi:hypothetical protein